MRDAKKGGAPVPAAVGARDRPSESRGTESAGGNRKTYRRPRLTVYGDLRTLTLGGSLGVGDSGNAFTEQPP